MTYTSSQPPLPPMLFDEKVMHALGYLVWRSGKCSKLVALKLLYLADRWHLRQYGRTVTRDKYFAMRLGPVPSRAKALIESQFKDVPSAENYLTITKLPEYEEIDSKAKPDLDRLSISDRKALDAAVKIYKKYGANGIVSFVHLFPEWKKKEALLKNKKRVKMDMDDFFLPCTEADKEYCDADEERLGASKECFHDYAS